MTRVLEDMFCGPLASPSFSQELRFRLRTAAGAYTCSSVRVPWPIARASARVRIRLVARLLLPRGGKKGALREQWR